jgi:hypothetical protein
MLKFLKSCWPWSEKVRKEVVMQAVNEAFEEEFKKIPKPAVKKATTRSKTMATKPGLYANIHAKQERIAKQKASGAKVETMRKPGTKGAPTAKAFKEAAKTTKDKK